MCVWTVGRCGWDAGETVHDGPNCLGTQIPSVEVQVGPCGLIQRQCRVLGVGMCLAALLDSQLAMAGLPSPSSGQG